VQWYIAGNCSYIHDILIISASEMTYIVSGGTSNSTHSLALLIIINTIQCMITSVYFRLCGAHLYIVYLCVVIIVSHCIFHVCCSFLVFSRRATGSLFLPSGRINVFIFFHLLRWFKFNFVCCFFPFFSKSSELSLSFFLFIEERAELGHKFVVLYCLFGFSGFSMYFAVYLFVFFLA